MNKSNRPTARVSPQACGLDLLLADAVGQFAHFTGVAAPRAAMAAARAA